MHGPTLWLILFACAAANASLSLLEDESWHTRVTAISSILKTGLSGLTDHPQVNDVRALGAIGLVETMQKMNVEAIQKWFVNQGVWIRPFGKLIYLMPPYIISHEALNQLIDAIISAVDSPSHFIS